MNLERLIQPVHIDSLPIWINLSWKDSYIKDMVISILSFIQTLAMLRWLSSLEVQEVEWYF